MPDGSSTTEEELGRGGRLRAADRERRGRRRADPRHRRRTVTSASTSRARRSRRAPGSSGSRSAPGADNARFFDSLDAVPTHCVTQGLGTVLDARRLVLVASGPRQGAAVAAAVEGPLRPRARRRCSSGTRTRSWCSTRPRQPAWPTATTTTPRPPVSERVVAGWGSSPAASAANLPSACEACDRRAQTVRSVVSDGCDHGTNSLCGQRTGVGICSPHPVDGHRRRSLRTRADRHERRPHSCSHTLSTPVDGVSGVCPQVVHRERLDRGHGLGRPEGGA